ncbi:D-alanyl-D-alanine carboxypeptidase [Clostridium acetobutylicum]|uniref:D-alanyl-D-alanine carboxypeptidase (Penicilin binding protein) n=1 Tax=Clostridium acetobutylicum (strain ATCC 824 / DSM 792 / JCM 1419 / IAM 19013 / LMG 5710 / NBRC 13948 / NRRL B-527 / VKM B-1787 / 2291 / W) TaxID=272562 RepID=Q97KC6_CLOAB|nr:MULTISPECIES: D-alanyl-D-alanine carboxypeptidase family protein [Clostridium]AAK78969.1 D-alanyl-D-alanine carboxypeptidase (penicilin binding protein) [Clostridium acetobutylicum ATCC 824]ADZ20043.1 D-alanyl-D-alanine carboxypeptidase (penicilin binding protein) [Clostridium acetobutylicum EA 2018]AEI34490.1 D-alanyl-D-alanine carboxypeptidase [Clostridium acetobutylicum DSM 1731]AWV81774.1 D-alanyl-D-alanine carboxypeptidase [Clostridium acetobutylicum]MBC2395318.1 D-alanyl-D-alanine car
MKRKLLSILLSGILSLSISSSALAAVNQPDIAGTSAISIDAKTGEVIYAKNQDAKAFPASTTKLLTSIILNENKKPSDYLYYSESAKEQPEYSFDKNIHPLNVGEKLPSDVVLKSLLMYSANDMAYVIAANLINKINSPTDEVKKDFSIIMNNEVKKLGLKNTHFVTPNGLHDPDHYSTAYDMSRIAKTAFSINWILKTISTQKTTVTLNDGAKPELKNTNKIIDPKEPVYDKTCIGGKTGYTNEAGRCLITIFNRNNKKIIGVVMKSQYDKDDVQVFKDMNNLINYSYSIKPTILYHKNKVYKYEIIKYRPLKYFGYYKTIKVPLVPKEDVTYYKNSFNDSEKKLTEKISINPWNLSTDTAVGNLTLKERDTLKQYKLYPSISTKNIMADNKFLYSGIVVAFLAVIALLVFGLVKFFKGRNKSSW